jgi:uncharacterized membrane protein YhaH (DUF805 family)
MPGGPLGANRRHSDLVAQAKIESDTKTFPFVYGLTNIDMTILIDATMVPISTRVIDKPGDLRLQFPFGRHHMGAFGLFFGFSGRINRGKFWLTLVVWLLIWIVAIPAFVVGGLAILGINISDGSLPSPEDPVAFLRLVRDYGILSLIILAFIIVSWVSAFAVGIKRLHDRDRSGWWILLFYFGPAVLVLAQNSADGALASLVLGLGALAISVWWLVELGFLRGTSGPNRFGPDPLKREVAVPA